MNLSDIISTIQGIITPDLITHAATTVLMTLIVVFLMSRIHPIKHIVIQIPPKDFDKNPRLINHRVTTKNNAELDQIEKAVDLLIKNNLEPENHLNG